MKLDRGNPNLMKRAALRVNSHMGLGAMPSALGDKNPPLYVRGGYVPIAKGPDVALPPSINIWKQDVYVPENVQPARRGADDHLKYKSRGM
jgi:hypothetical protein